MVLSHKNAFGLDISDAGLKLVWLDDGPRIRSYHAVHLSKDVMQNGRIMDAAAFKSGIRELIEGAKGEKVTTPWVIASLPETHVFLKTITMPKSEEKQGTEHFVFSRIGEHVPLSLDEEFVAWHEDGIAKGTSGDRRLIIAAAARDLVDEYERALRGAGLKVEALQTESTALAKALIKGWALQERGKEVETYPSAVLVNFKPDHAIIAFVDGGAILLTMAVQIANLPIERFLTRIEEKIEQGNAWYERESGQRFKRVVIVGGDPFQERLFNEIRGKKAYSAEAGDPYINLDHKKIIRQDFQRLANTFAMAIGLALG